MMKKRSILLGVTAMLTVVMLSSFAAGPQCNLRNLLRHSPETRANLVTMVMKDKLTLNDKQFEKAYQINLKYAKLIQPYFKADERTPEITDEVVALNQRRLNELRNILTAEQLKQADEIRQQRIKRLEVILNRMKANQFSNQ